MELAFPHPISGKNTVFPALWGGKAFLIIKSGNKVLPHYFKFQFKFSVLLRLRVEYLSDSQTLFIVDGLD